MKVRYIGAIAEVVTIIPGDEPTQLSAKQGDELTVTKAQAVVLLDGYPNPQSNFEPADKAAWTLVAAPVAEKE